MKKQFSHTLLAVVLSSGLVACGGGGSSSSSSGNGSSAGNQSDNNTTKLSLFAFDTSTNYNYSTNTTQLTYIKKENLIYNNSYTEVEEVLFGTKPNFDDTFYVVGENFFSEIKPDTQFSNKKNVKVTQLANKDYQISYQVVGKNNSQYNITDTIRPIDISGEIYLDSFTINNIKLEFLGNFRYLDKFPKALTFPTGSICYTDVSSQQTKVVYNFRSNDSMDHLNSLDEFVAELDTDEKNSIRNFNVGLNNEIPMIEFTETHSQEKTYALSYNGKVYAYNIEEEPASWIADTNNPLYCQALNDVASNYLTTEINKAIQ